MIPLPDAIRHVLAVLTFMFAGYHFITHLCVLFRVRLLPRKDLVRVRYYFLLDTINVFLTCFIITGKAKLLACVQICQHLYYYIGWDKTKYAKKVISWSSLDWIHGPTRNTWAWVELIGTAFDAMCHAVCMYLLGQMMSAVEIVTFIVIAHCLAYLLLWSPRWAWSSPYGTIPAWVQKRIKPIDAGQNPDFQWNLLE